MKILNGIKDIEGLKIQKRFIPCEQPIVIAVKSYTLTDTGIDIEFHNEDDAALFRNNQDKEIKLIFNQPE